MEIIHKYFPNLTADQEKAFSALQALYEEWNAQINVISRKDLDHLYERHVLHSLAIYKFIQFKSGTSVMDIGTGGGFPGIPLAIMMPEVKFLLTDSIGKKIKVVEAVASSIGAKNIRAQHVRSEQVREKFDFVVSRAVAELKELLAWCNVKIKKDQINAVPNGLICLKGGDLGQEFQGLSREIEIYPLSDWFEEEFFQTKKLVYVPLT
jgi:16S rRNA (guanine527-N7)-methyltransferase